MTRDSQRSAVYKWEHQITYTWPMCNRKLSLDECKELIHRVWNDYRPGDDPPKLKDGRGTRRATGSRWYINLPVWARTEVVVLHELAHSLQTSGAWHGPQFATLVLDLWEHYANIPRAKARSIGVHQKPRRVRFAAAADVPHKPTRKWRQWLWAVESVRKELTELKKELDGMIAAEPPKYG